MAEKGERFKNIVAKSQIKKGLRVVLEYIGEGLSGDYNSADPEDEPLLRFTIYKDKQQVDDGSYCTLLSTSDDRKFLSKATKSILSEAENSLTNGNFKKTMEWMSHIQIVNGKIV